MPGPAPGSDRRWTQVTVTVARPLDVELAADQLWLFGPDAVEEQNPAGSEATTLIAGYSDPDPAHRAAAALDRLHPGAVSVDSIRWGTGLDDWRRWARVERAHPFVLVPTWLEPPLLGPGEVAVHLDPGHAFGSGSHPTTRLVLSALARHLRPGDRVLDVGSGSGVLAVGAALLGAGRVVATDIDPASPAIVQANAERNDVADVLEVTDTPLAELALREQFTLVLANLLAPVLAEQAPHLVAATRPGETLVVSGLLVDQVDATLAVLSAAAHTAGRRLGSPDTTTDDVWAAVAVTLG